MYQSHLTTYFLDGVALEKLGPRLAFGNSGFLFGESVFTTAAIMNGYMSFYEAHLRRLQQNWRWLFDDSLSETELGQFIKSSYQQTLEVHKQNSHENSWRIRINIFKDEESRSRCLTILTPWSFNKPVIESLEVKPGLQKSSAKNFGVKQPNYSEPFRQKRQSKTEVLFLDNEENIGECATANIVFFLKGEFVTPRLENGILKGIGLTDGLFGLEVKELPLKKDVLDEVKGAWLINSLRGPQEVLCLQGRSLAESHEYNEKIQSCFKRNIEERQELL